MPERKEVIEYVEEKDDDEELPDVQMGEYDTGKFEESPDTIKSPMPNLGEGFNNLQDSIYIAKKNS